jgi:hypothetical protein
MRHILITISFLFGVIYVFGQVKAKQSSPYFEFSYNCELLNNKYDSQRSVMTYYYEDKVNDVVIVIDVSTRETHWGNKESIDALVRNYGNVKISAGYFCGNYALITDGKENDGSVFKSAMFAKAKRMYRVDILSSSSESLLKAYNQIEKTFIFK